MLADGPNVFTYLPAALRNYAAWKRGRRGGAPGDPRGRLRRPGPSSSGTTTTPSTGTSRSASTARSSTPATTAPFEARHAVLPAGRRAGVRRRLRLREPPAGGQGRRRARVADRAHRQADADPARHARHAAADPHRLGRLHAHDPRRRPRLAAPLLRDRGRQPRRLALRPLPGRPAPDPAVLPQRVHGLRGVDRARRRRRRRPRPWRARRAATSPTPARCGRPQAGAGAAASAKPRLRLRVTPRRARAGRRTRFRFRVTARGRPVRGAKVRFMGRTKRTGRRGRARMVRRPARRGVRRAVAAKRGFRPARARVRIRS